jgi:heme A synthase
VSRIPIRPAAGLVLAAALALVALGGVVHTTGSSLACPDWPLCHGEIAPRMEGGVLFEHSHRLLALAVALGVFGLPWTAAGRARGLAVIACGVVVVQALLGALTVLARLPPAVSILHLGGATATVVLLATLASGESARRSPIVDRALAVVVAQVLLGAAVRHLGASAACGRDVLACEGELAPAHALGWLHLAHRALGVVAGVLALGAALAARRDQPWLAVGIALGVPLQIALGLASVALGPRLVPVTLHLLVGELLVAALAFLAPRSITPGRLAPRSPPRAARSP